jgi:hypothetical protein
MGTTRSNRHISNTKMEGNNRQDATDPPHERPL